MIDGEHHETPAAFERPVGRKMQQSQGISASGQGQSDRRRRSGAQTPIKDGANRFDQAGHSARSRSCRARLISVVGAPSP